jgi:hypothetical protein
MRSFDQGNHEFIRGPGPNYHGAGPIKARNSPARGRKESNLTGELSLVLGRDNQEGCDEIRLAGNSADDRPARSDADLLVHDMGKDRS